MQNYTHDFISFAKTIVCYCICLHNGGVSTASVPTSKKALL